MRKLFGKRIARRSSHVPYVHYNTQSAYFGGSKTLNSRSIQRKFVLKSIFNLKLDMGYVQILRGVVAMQLRHLKNLFRSQIKRTHLRVDSMIVGQTLIPRYPVLFLLISLYCFQSAATANWNFPSSLIMSSIVSATETVEKTTKEAGVAPAWPTTGNRNILISGGAGYIGTHTIVCLLEG